jgi:hypothetical protein
LKQYAEWLATDVWAALSLGGMIPAFWPRKSGIFSNPDNLHIAPLEL